jgi:uncharacterized repeat protein (TIGR03806 family)
MIRCSVSSAGSKAVNLDVSQPAFEKLSEYNFFTGILNHLDPNQGVLPYDLITPLFTDYAEKSRFVWMPDGTSAAYNEKEVVDLPVGAVLIKNFFYYHDVRQPEKGRRIMETRLLVHREDKWDALTYIWDDAQKDAVLEVAGDIKPVQYTAMNGEMREVNYVIPNKNQCKGCHEYKGALMPIGPKVRNLNMDYAYEDGPMNQLDKWASLNYLSGYSRDGVHGKVADWDDPASGSLQDRALAYLEVNCGHCHRPEGPASISGLNLMTDETTLFNLGFCKSPVSAGKGSGGFTYDIVPGEPERSILVYRMTTDDPGARMPEVGRSIMHVEGVALVSEWIASLDGGCPDSIDGD